MQRTDILAEMKRTADENGGIPLGKSRFERATGISEYDWLKYWSRFGDLQHDAGFEPNQLNAAYDDVYLFEKLIQLTREQQRFPTERERKTKAHHDPDFPSAGVFRRLGNKIQLITRLMEYCADKPEYVDVIKLLAPFAEVNPTDSKGHGDDLSDEKSSYGFVYLVKGHPGGVQGRSH